MDPEKGFHGHVRLRSNADGHRLEHRGQDAELAFHEISPEIGRKLREVCSHHHAEIWRRRRPRRAQLGDPRLGRLTIVLPDKRAETSRFDRRQRAFC